jgi:hypothetical protein
MMGIGDMLRPGLDRINTPPWINVERQNMSTFT